MGKISFKKVLLTFVLAILIFLLININSLIYGLNQLFGQVNILFHAQEMETVLESDSFPDSLKTKLYYIQDIKSFSENHLGYEKTNNYSTVFDQKGKDILWIVTACPPFELKAFEWKFPLFGSFPYKGFFDLNKAKEEQKRMKLKGLDTDLRRVSGWSTLGWFRDPVLSKMLYKTEGDLANTIIHELTHSEIFIKDQVDLNENLATFVGDYGALKYLELKYGKEHFNYQDYLKDLEEEKIFSQYVINGALKLDSLYNSLSADLDSVDKSQIKENFINNWVINIDTVSMKDYTNVRNRLLLDLPNNTFFMSYVRYNSLQNSFESEFLEKKDISFRDYVDTLFQRYSEN